ncbi:MAG: L-histidine N(alpha)-methyltransferase [Verrucomicrobia bacterium]|nr:L-histidine N(alpha)-methyltransferase [Verrucomicrobiota bacterium]
MSDQKIPVLDLAPATEDFRAQVIAGLSRDPKTLPCKFFYDETGSALFGKICELPEYYITRTELKMLHERGVEIAAALGPRIELIGLGTGAGTKTRILLQHLDSPIAYVPVDISKEQLTQSTAEFSRLFPALEILPVSADYLNAFELPRPIRRAARRVVYFPGSTIGNLEPRNAREFLRKIAELAGAHGALLMGVDLKKSKAVLERAYNDNAGITAQFNLNLLARANRELGADFDVSRWRHHACYNERDGRIEMHLVSSSRQKVHLSERSFTVEPGEHIVTEFSYKYSPDELTAMGKQAGLCFEQLWSDDEQLFGLFLFRVEDRA